MLQGLGGLPSLLEAEAAAVREKEQEAEAWGQALTGVARALSEGRRRLWEEAARKLGALLAAPAAFQGEHFLQVLLRLRFLQLCCSVLCKRCWRGLPRCSAAADLCLSQPGPAASQLSHAIETCEHAGAGRS